MTSTIIDAKKCLSMAGTSLKFGKFNLARVLASLRASTHGQNHPTFPEQSDFNQICVYLFSSLLIFKLHKDLYNFSRNNNFETYSSSYIYEGPPVSETGFCCLTFTGPRKLFLDLTIHTVLHRDQYSYCPDHPSDCFHQFVQNAT